MSQFSNFYFPLTWAWVMAMYYRRAGGSVEGWEMAGCYRRTRVSVLGQSINLDTAVGQPMSHHPTSGLSHQESVPPPTDLTLQCVMRQTMSNQHSSTRTEIYQTHHYKNSSCEQCLRVISSRKLCSSKFRGYWRIFGGGEGVCTPLTSPGNLPLPRTNRNIELLYFIFTDMVEKI